MKHQTYLTFILAIISMFCLHTAKAQQCDSFQSLAVATSAPCAGGFGDVQFEVAGGTAPYEYVLFNLDGSTELQTIVSEDEIVIFSNLVAGNYTIQATDSNNCVDTIAIDLLEPEFLIVDLAIFNPICAGDNSGSVSTMVSGGTPPYLYSLNGPSGVIGSMDSEGDYTNLVSGMYELQVIDANACITLENFEILDPLPINVITNSSDVNCSGEASGGVEAFASEGSPPYDYILFTSSGDLVSNSIDGIFTNLTSGVYFFEVVDTNGCNSTSDLFTISEPEVLNLVVTEIAQIACSGDSNGALQATASGGTMPYTYQVSDTATGIVLPPNNNGLFEGLGASTYQVSVEDANGCSVFIDFFITQPDSPLLIENIVSTTVSCFGQMDGSIEGTVSGGVPPYQYSLLNSSGFELLSNESGQFFNLEGGEYMLQVTDINGCSEINIVSVEEPLPVELLIEIDYIDPVNNTITATGIGGFAPYIYELFENGSLMTTNDTGIFEQITSGQYTILITDVLGCLALQDIVISYNDLNNDGIADNDEDVNGNGILDDDDTDGDGIPDYLDEDDDNDGVDSSGEIEASGNRQFKMLSENFLDTDGDGVPNHRDTDDDGDGILTIDEDYNGNGDPTDDDTDNSGVADYLEANVTLSISEYKLSDRFSFYPNPASKNIRLEFEEILDSAVLITLLNIEGKKVQSKHYNLTRGEVRLDVSHLSSGIYLLKVDSNNQTGIKRLFIQ